MAFRVANDVWHYCDRCRKLIACRTMNVLGLGTYDSDEEIDLKEETLITANEHLFTALPTKFGGPSSSSIVVESNETEGEETKSIDDQTALEFGSSEKVPSASSVIQNTYNHLHELPPSPRDQPNPKTVRKIGEYLELKEISGFNLTEVRYIPQWSYLLSCSICYCYLNDE